MKKKQNSLCIITFILTSLTFPLYATEYIQNSYIVGLKDQTNTRSSANNITIQTKVTSLMSKVHTYQNSIATNKMSTQQTSNKVAKIFEHAFAGFSATLTEEAMHFLQIQPEVSFVEKDVLIQLYESDLNSNVDVNSTLWGLDRIDQRSLPLDGTFNTVMQGANVNIYIVDTGLDSSHQEFLNRVGGGYNATMDNLEIDDCVGHGTHVSGISSGSTVGVAKQSIVHPVKVFECSTSTPYSVVLYGLDWIIENHIPPAVVNMSLNYQDSSLSQSFTLAIANVLNAGIPVVVSAGNYHQNACNYPPANVIDTITVAATDQQDSIAYFSNYGECVDLYAPGVEIYSSAVERGSTSFNYACQSTTGDPYSTCSGTSMAAPHVSGVVALYLESNPELTPSEIKTMLLTNASENVVNNNPYDTPNKLLYSVINQDYSWLLEAVNVVTMTE